ncbi:MAG: hypothetical protein K0R65_2886 [Crocinitomicaceae bacterium]|jgi:hypothetical protein|nr:hypothetical protein [Crocinitomicaceae bacterium]
MKYFLTLSLFLSLLAVQAQNNFSNITGIDLQLINQAFAKREKNPAAFEAVKSRFPVYRINGQDYLSLLAQANPSFNAETLRSQGIIVGKPIKNIVTLKLPLTLLNTVSSLQGIDYVEIPSKISPDLDKAVKDVRADSVQQGINLPEAYTGQDIYIGITDWGFDYTHPNFYDTSLQQTRIVAAWDQFKQNGPHPAGYSYGTEYATENDLLAAHSDTANIYSYGYHGSHVAGICGGSGAGTVYRGVAFEANFLMATFLIDAASVIDAYEWMYEKALADSKRLVINQSWGLHYMGNLDGTSLLSQAIDAYTELGVVFVSSGGNNGNVNFHLNKTFANNELKSKIDFYDYSANEFMWGQSVTQWGEPGKAFQTSIQVTNSSNTVLVESPFYSTATTVNYVDSILVTGTDTIFFNVSCENANPQNNRPHIRLRVKNTHTALKVLMRTQAADGTVHSWNVTELTTGVGNWGMPFSTSGGGTTAGNTNYGISEPACTNGTIAVAAYAAQFQQGQGTVGGGIAGFSSWGPTLDDRVKPDISAPGVNVGSSFSSYTDESFSSAATVNFNGRDYPFAKISGTSMSAPMVSGIVALILDANPYLSPPQVKEIIRETARTDNFTGVIPAEGSTRWGYGKINAYAAVQLALNTVGTVEMKRKEFSLYPNPASETLHLKLEGGIKDQAVKIFDMTGKTLERISDNGQISISDLSKGAYLIQLEVNGKIYQEKFVKE